MAINLVDLIKNAVAGSISDQLGSAVGLDKKQTASALDAVVPVLLGSLVKKSATPSGATELGNLLRDQDPSFLDNLGGLLGGGSSSVANLIAQGSKFLPMLLGSGQGNIIATLVKLLGFNEKSITSLLGLLAPIVMSVVGKQAKSSGGFDVGSLTNLLGGQKNFIANALPSELQGAFSLADNVGAAATRTAEVAKSSNPLQWLLPLIALAVLGYLGYTFLFNKPADVKPTTATQGSKPSVASAPSVDLPSLPDLTDMKKSLTATFEGLTGTLEGITDEASAKSSLEKIESAVKTYTDLGVDKLPVAAQKTLTKFLGDYLKPLTAVLEKLYLIPGVKDIIEPVVGPLVKAISAVGV